VERQGEGIPGRDGLLHQIKQPQVNFRVAVRRTAPCFVPQYCGRPASPASLSDCASATSGSATSAFVPQQVGKHTRPPFLEGEEDVGEIGLNDGKEVFIDDVLQTAEWCVP
jgi:hypothetical protein